MEIIAKGAEAAIYRIGDGIVKERISKGYRLQEIDESLRKKRTRSEARLMREARRAGILVPQITAEDKYKIEMEFIDGNKAMDELDWGNMIKICRLIGESIGKMHSFNIIHGDLTTSNMIVKEGKLYFIDFGLGFQSSRIEDKAVDLRLLKQALQSTHHEIAEKAWKIILKAYQNNCSDASEVIRTLDKIQKRGRYSKR